MNSSEARLLGVAPDAGLDEIKRAYRKAALTHHPDQSSHPEAARHFRRLTEAYRLLSEQAQLRSPPTPKRQAAALDRIRFILVDIRSLLARWSPDRWSTVVDGLPARVWVAGALDVLGRTWPGVLPPEPVDPTTEGITAAVIAWETRLAHPPLPSLAPPSKKTLTAVLAPAEARVQTLVRLRGR